MSCESNNLTVVKLHTVSFIDFFSFFNIISQSYNDYKEWCDEFETGLNIIIAIVQKV